MTSNEWIRFKRIIYTTATSCQPPWMFWFNEMNEVDLKFALNLVRHELSTKTWILFIQSSIGNEWRFNEFFVARKYFSQF